MADHRDRRSTGPARSVRVRTTGLAVVVVGLAMAAGMAILVHVFRDSLLGELEISARLRAGELAEDLAGGLDLRTAAHRGPRGPARRPRRPDPRRDAQRRRTCRCWPGRHRTTRRRWPHPSIRGPSSSWPSDAGLAAGPAHPDLVGVSTEGVTDIDRGDPRAGRASGCRSCCSSSRRPPGRWWDGPSLRWSGSAARSPPSPRPSCTGASPTRRATTRSAGSPAP